MRGTKTILAVAVLAAIVGLAPVANAQSYTLEFLGVGSSAMFNTLSAAAFTDLCSSVSGSTCQHWSAKGTNSGDGQNWAQAVDSRSTSIPVEAGNLFVAWDTTNHKTWAYLSVDSVLGNRLFFAVPRATLQVDSGSLSATGQNLVPAAILYNRQTSADQADSTTGIPTGVLAAISTTFTAAISDVRPEDAKFEINRVLAAYNINGNGLGYGTSGNATCFQGTDNWPVSANLGCPVYGVGGRATPVQYAIQGTDPFSKKAAWKYKTIEVGAEPVVFVYNVTNASGLGAVGPDGTNVAFKNLNSFTATEVFNGTLTRAQDLDPSLTAALQALSVNGPIFPWLREPLSGTMTTTEFNVFRNTVTLKNIPNAASQETGVELSTTCTVGVNCADPLYLPAVHDTASVRQRAIGTGAELGGSSGVGGVKNTPDGIGYAFFSFGNVNTLAGTPGQSGAAGGKGRYVTLDGVDPINQGYGPYTFDSQNYLAGQLPNCVAPCQANGGTSLPNVRNGSYPAWTIIRAITDATGANLTNTQALVTAAQNEVNNTNADFVPFVCTNPTTCNIGGSTEPGLQVFHSHFSPTGVPFPADGGGAPTGPHNGNVWPEDGGDVGGEVFTNQADLDYHTDTGAELLSLKK
jgi:hypothetical protein